MYEIKTTEELSIGMVVLSGTAYYKVESYSSNAFRGLRWDEDSKSWGPIRVIPLPSPTYSTHVVPEELFC